MIFSTFLLVNILGSTTHHGDASNIASQTWISRGFSHGGEPDGWISRQWQIQITFMNHRPTSYHQVISSLSHLPEPENILVRPRKWMVKEDDPFLFRKTLLSGAKLFVFYGGVSLCVSKLKATTEDDRLESPFPMTPCVPLLQCSNNGVNLGPATW